MKGESHHYQGHRERLRDRFRKTGLAGFADYEVVELILTLAVPRSDVKQPAKALIARYNDVRGILDARTDELSATPGVGPITPVSLKIIKAVAALYVQQGTEGLGSPAESEQLAAMWRMRIGSSANEIFEVGYLNSAQRLLRDGVEILEEGTIDRAAVYPRRVVEAALRRGAAGVVLAHNHPNGAIMPTEHDKLLTRAIVLAAETVNIRIFDHLIVSAHDSFSFRKAGLL